MKLNSLQVLNFMRVSEVDIDLSDNVLHLFCGHNEVGKTTLQEAIRYGLYGETVRVSKKGDYKLMVKDGAKSGTIKIDIDDEVVTRNVATSKTDPEVFEPPDALRYALDAHLFSRLSGDERRKFLFRALGIKIKPSAIKERLMKRDIDEHCIDGILPMLVSGGFGGAYKEARNKTTESRGIWTGITGERYGSVKAEEWAAEKQFTDADNEALVKARNERNDIEAQIEELVEERGALAAGSAPKKHEGMQLTCPECKTKLVYSMGKVSRYVEQLDEVPEENQTPSVLDKKITSKKAERDAINHEIVALETKELQDTQLEMTTDKALKAHQQVVRWRALEDILAPDGLPAEIISEAITPLNKRLKESAAMTGWKTAQIDPEMNIYMDGRPYSLQSESSKWRCDAMIAEAISHLTKTGVLVLDRVDVLDMASRVQLIKWMVAISKSEYDSILMFATLKEPPALPPAVAVHWMQDGALTE